MRRRWLVKNLGTFRGSLTSVKSNGKIKNPLFHSDWGLILVPEEVATLLRRGALLEDAGDADGAYQCYLEAANLGSIDAMFWLAETMDERYG